MVAWRVISYSLLLGAGETWLGCFDKTLADDRLEFFESSVRPILIEHCYECHSQATEQSGGLTLDTRQGWSLGGDSGPAIAIGDPASSLLHRAVLYEDPHLRMPPEGKLPQQKIDILSKWIRDGASDPRTDEVASSKQSTGLSLADSQKHWAYRPLERPAPPKLDSAILCADESSPSSSSAIDLFLESSRREIGLSTLASVDRAALLRRLSYDLHGLPPSPEEYASFLADDRPDAIVRVVDQMLSSPRYAERMARRWLDVSRYAESLTLRGFILPQAWRYRDYCIDAFAQDLPYDQFVREQVAGDLLDSSSGSTAIAQASDLEVPLRQKRHAAISFLLLGNTNLEEQDKTQLEMDIIDEQLDTIGRAVLGQTLGCARCHDHKFDPIPTQDYYAMAAILKQSKVVEHENVSKWIERPLPLSIAEEEQFVTLEKQRKAIQQEIEQWEARQAKNSAKTILDLQQLAGVVIDDTEAIRVGEWTASNSVPEYVGRGYLHDGARDPGTKTITFQPNNIAAGYYDVRLSYSHGDNRASNTRVRIFSAEGEIERRIDQKKAGVIDGLWISLGRFRFEENGQAYVVVSNESANGHVIADAIQFLPEKLLSTPTLSTTESTRNNTQSLEGTESAERKLEQLKQAKGLLDEKIARRPRAMGIIPVSKKETMRVHIRGSVHSLGKSVDPGLLSLFAWQGEDASHIDSNQGQVSSDSKNVDRLTLAQWLTRPDHPLTARVYVNRVWNWLIGEGLVSSVDNFGTTGDSPTHPELLDYLTIRFIENEWSTKWLIRQIVLSDVYGQQANGITTNSELDPENRYLWRSHRKRLDAESIRDTLGLISGDLDLQMNGSRIPNKLDSDYGYAHDSICRSIYVPAFRNSSPALLRAFDAADPSMVVGKRNRTTVAQQAFVMLNDPWVQKAVQSAAMRMASAPGTMGEKLDRLGWTIWGRPFRSDEFTAATELLGDIQEMSEDRWAILIRSMYASPDFLFLK